MTPNVWWKHAFVYAIDVHDPKSGGLKGVTDRMDSLKGFGVDAILLRGLQSGDEPGMDPAAGSMDDFDELLRQSSSHTLRIMVEIKPSSAKVDVTSLARFWLSRGVAGFRLVAVAGDTGAQMTQLRNAVKGYVGERVIIGDAVQHAASVRSGKYDGPQLLLDASMAVAPLDVAAIRTAMERNDELSKAGGPNGPVPMVSTTDEGAGPPELGKAVATLLLSSRGGTLIRAGQEGSPDTPEGQALGQWYRQMSSLEHSNATIRTGANTMLNHDAEGVVAWVRKPQIVSYNSPPVIFLLNMTGKPATISLEQDMKNLHFKGVFLKTVLRSDVGMGGMPLASLTLAPYAIYIGELSY
jgi:alpha-glucosidase